MRSNWALREFFKSDAAGGVLLICATILALIFASSGLRGAYDALLGLKFTVSLGEYGLSKPLLLWINDGLMAVFFLLVGLELKRELLDGELSDFRRATLPIAAALGGVLAPALIYIAVNSGDAEALRGWAIPAATDIAFALGILALLGGRVPIALKIFLLAVAIIDDLAAIIIIALFYTDQISMMALAAAAVGVAALAGLNRAGVTRIAPYIIVGAVVWVFLLKSGVHATLGGVVTALFIPHTPKAGGHPEDTVLISAEHGLKPWVAFAIMPIFAFANAGVDLSALPLSSLSEGVTLGVALGLMLGKPLGVTALSWLAVRCGVAALPAGVSWLHLIGASLLAGVGFTMSLFIGTLAFDTLDQAANVRVGVLLGSLLSGVAGYLLLRSLLQPQGAPEQIKGASA